MRILVIFYWSVSGLIILENSVLLFRMFNGRFRGRMEKSVD